jgi:hypothetical protein
VRRGAGFAAVDYLAAVAVVAAVVVALTTLAPRTPSRRAPVDVIPPIVRLLGTPADALTPRPARPRVGPPRPSRPRPRPRVAPDTVLLPEWW